MRVISKYDGEIRINTKIDTEKASSQLLSLQNRINKTAQKIDTLTQKMRQMEAPTIKTDAFKELENSMQEAQSHLQKLRDEQAEWESIGISSGGAWDALCEKMGIAEERVFDISEQMDKLKASGGAFKSQKDTEAYKKIVNDLQNANDEMDMLKAKQQEVAAKQQKFNGNIGKTTQEVERTNKKFSNVLRTMKQMVLSMAVFSVMQNGIEAVKEGIQNLAKSSSSFNAKMSEMASATATLKNALATAFAPIITMITPAIVTLCNWITKAVNLINRFLSAISGKKTWTRAKNQQVNYAQSLEDTANAAKKAAGTLQSFNELNVISSQDSSGGGTGGSGDSSGGFEEVPLTESDFEWVEKIKKIFEAILPLAVAIGAALLTWKLTDFLTSLIKVHPILGKILSILFIIAGVALMIVSYLHMWNEGVDWKGLIGYIAGVALAFAGLYALFGPLVAGIFLIVASAAGLILALKDIEENGLNAKNASLLLVSALGLVVGVFLVFGATAAIVTAAILAIGLGIADLIKNGVNLKNGIMIVAGVFALVASVAGAAVGAIVALVAGLVLACAADWENFKRTVWEPIKSWFNEMWENFTQIGQGFKNMLDGISKFVNGVFSGDWKMAWEGIKETFGGAWDGIVGILKASANLIIGILNTVYNFVCGVVNAIINGINKISFTTPDWLNYLHDGWGGQTFGGFNIPTIEPINIPYLANGGITTGETLAKIGDNPGGQEAVLPLSSNTEWMDSLADKIASKLPAGSVIQIQGDPQGMFKIIRKEAGRYYRTTGNPAFDY